MDLLISAFRSLRAHAAFSALIVLLLAVGIGANTAIFSVVDAVLLKPLPYPEPGELVPGCRAVTVDPVEALRAECTALMRWTLHSRQAVQPVRSAGSSPRTPPAWFANGSGMSSLPACSRKMPRSTPVSGSATST